MVTYRELKNKLDLDTKYSSTSRTCVEHPNFKLLLIDDFIPYFLYDLRNDIGIHNCFICLAEILGESPVQKENRGYVEKMKHDWLKWAKNSGYEL